MALPNLRPMAWDPKSPATLLLPTLDPEKNELRVDAFLSHDGVGCNPHERSALMKLVTAHGDYHRAGQDNVKALSRTYRSALRDCLAGWEGDEAIDDEESLELLKLVYAVTHLSEIFLLSNDGDSWSTPGAATADTVRYLRLHHMEDPYAVVGEGLDDMLQSSQPEQYGAVYWKLLRTLVLRGCLDDAWALISRHHLYRRCFEETEILDEFHAITIEQDREGFRVLRSLLLSAPLPGGRSEWNDDGLGDDDNEGDEDNVLLMDGVPRDAYKLWDSDSYSSDRDFPLDFDPHAAISVHKAWKREVIDNASLHGLLRRLPQLQANVLSILSGRFDTDIFDSWSEALCAELLYQRPGLCPRDLHVRTADVMQKLGVSVSTEFDQVIPILSVMKGDAGRVVEVLHQYGGGSGAALPATMVCSKPIMKFCRLEIGLLTPASPFVADSTIVQPFDGRRTDPTSGFVSIQHQDRIAAVRLGGDSFFLVLVRAGLGCPSFDQIALAVRHAQRRRSDYGHSGRNAREARADN